MPVRSSGSSHGWPAVDVPAAGCSCTLLRGGRFDVTAMAPSNLATRRGSHPGRERFAIRELAAMRAEFLDDEEIAPTRMLCRLGSRRAGAAAP